MAELENERVQAIGQDADTCARIFSPEPIGSPPFGMEDMSGAWRARRCFLRNVASFLRLRVENGCSSSITFCGTSSR